MCELPWKSWRENSRKDPALRLGEEQQRQRRVPARMAGPKGAFQEFTDAPSDSGTDGRTVRVQPPLPLLRGMVPISRSLQPCYGMRGL